MNCRKTCGICQHKNHQKKKKASWPKTENRKIGGHKKYTKCLIIHCSFLVLCWIFHSLSFSQTMTTTRSETNIQTDENASFLNTDRLTNAKADQNILFQHCSTTWRIEPFHKKQSHPSAQFCIILFSGFLGFLRDSNLLTHSSFNLWLGPACGRANVDADNSKCINWAGYNTGSFCSMCGRCHKHNVCHNGLKFNLHKGHLQTPQKS